MPAEAGIQPPRGRAARESINGTVPAQRLWIPACAGMTTVGREGAMALDGFAAPRGPLAMTVKEGLCEPLMINPGIPPKIPFAFGGGTRFIPLS